MLNTTPSPFVDNPSTMSLNYTDHSYSTTSSDTDEATFGTVPIIIIGIIFAIITTLGNALVMISIRVDKQLQTISNYFIFSLAVADTCVGIVS